MWTARSLPSTKPVAKDSCRAPWRRCASLVWRFVQTMGKCFEESDSSILRLQSKLTFRMLEDLACVELCSTKRWSNERKSAESHCCGTHPSLVCAGMVPWGLIQCGGRNESGERRNPPRVLGFE